MNVAERYLRSNAVQTPQFNDFLHREARQFQGEIAFYGVYPNSLGQLREAARIVNIQAPNKSHFYTRNTDSSSVSILPEHEEIVGGSMDATNIHLYFPPEIHTGTINVGHGNPAAELALEHIFAREGLPYKSYAIELPAKVLRHLHKKLRTDPQAREEYSENGENLRRNPLGIYAIGMMSIHDMLKNDPEMFKSINPNKVWVGIQEHQLGAFDKESFHMVFPRGGLCVVPDVKPKKSAVEMAQKLGVTLGVFNTTAFNEITHMNETANDEEKVNVELIKPVFDDAFTPEDPQINQKHIVVKFSGSGAPKEWITNVREALNQVKAVNSDYTYTIYTGKKIYSDSEPQGVDAPQDSKRYLTEVYKALHTEPPGLILCDPSEMIGITANLKLKYGTKCAYFPPTGEHEKNNAEWAEKLGVATSVRPAIGIDGLAQEVDWLMRDESTQLTQDQITALNNELGNVSVGHVVYTMSRPKIQ